jgi:hypothetical protein
MIYKNDKERRRAAVFYFTSAAASLLLAYPIMKLAMLLEENLSIDKSVGALLGGGVLLGLSMLVGRWLGSVLFHHYYTTSQGVDGNGIVHALYRGEEEYVYHYEIPKE